MMECSYTTFMNGKPHSFKGTEGVVGLKCWFEKMEQVFEICKCAEDDKVKFAMCTFEGEDLEAIQQSFPMNWSWMCHELVTSEKKKIERSNQFRVELQELVKAIRGNGKTTKETPTTITTTTTITATETTIITSNKTGDRKMSGHMLQPQLEERFMLEIYQNATSATYIIMDRVLKSVRDVKE
ncbi:hypothetical protein Tco_0821608 [Tanacetum coccineum]|uniref:Reverse transcriptase domain-containing protein n=1 Tax=Tanacetum coccineum TaxID=301880 RepID=A0ABQ5AEH6_9ASTR